MSDMMAARKLKNKLMVTPLAMAKGPGDGDVRKYGAIAHSPIALERV